MSIRQADDTKPCREGVRRVSGRFATAWGAGEVTLVGGCPVVVDLPPVPDGSPDGGQHTGNYEDEVALGRWTAELEAYFRGERLSWRADEISPLLEQKSSFARRTIEALMAVPPGCTVSYGDLAALAGYPRAARAVGTVMSTNALPIVIPCHRVVRSDGSLGRYGTDDSWKERLLEHERRSQKKA